jgi:hypothetical protein
MLWCNQWSAFANRIEVVDGQVLGDAADLAPATLTADLAAELLPRWI